MQSTFFFSVKWTQQEVLNSASGGCNILDLHFLLAAAEDNLACQNLMIEEENDDNASLGI
jgi:hypothetical protein